MAGKHCYGCPVHISGANLRGDLRSETTLYYNLAEVIGVAERCFDELNLPVRICERQNSRIARLKYCQPILYRAHTKTRWRFPSISSIKYRHFVTLGNWDAQQQIRNRSTLLSGYSSSPSGVKSTVYSLFLGQWIRLWLSCCYFQPSLWVYKGSLLMRISQIPELRRHVLA